MKFIQIDYLNGIWQNTETKKHYRIVDSRKNRLNSWFVEDSIKFIEVQLVTKTIKDWKDIDKIDSCNP